MRRGFESEKNFEAPSTLFCMGTCSVAWMGKPLRRDTFDFAAKLRGTYSVVLPANLPVELRYQRMRASAPRTNNVFGLSGALSRHSNGPFSPGGKKPLPKFSLSERPTLSIDALGRGA